MKAVNVHQAKTSLSKLLARAARGEEIVIAKAGKPVAKLIPVAKGARRTPGLVPGLKIDKTFWQPLPERELAAWEK